MTTAPDPTSVHAWNLVHAPFTATTWRRTAYALLALPLGLACIPLALLGAPTARWQRGLVHRFLDPDRTDLPGRPRAGGLPHALLATPLNLVTAFVTLYGWSIVPPTSAGRSARATTTPPPGADPPSPGPGPSTRWWAASASCC